uniref:Bm2292 n=1 Tax=Brugia malayi TaxID=6279 RepID=A0A0K0J5A4_BRUMA|nr:Bm2292 [Brugia malayi]
MHSMSMSFGSDQQETGVTDGNFIANSNIIISDYDQSCQNGMLNNVAVEENKMNDTGSYQTVYSEYQSLVGSSGGMTMSTIPPASTPTSYQQLNQMSPQSTAASASQFDHITVMTNLQQSSDLYTGIPVSSVSNGIAYTIPNSANTAALQIYPPSAITQQVQQSVPALNAMPPTLMQNRPDYGMQRLQTSRASNSRTKTIYPSLLPVTGRGSNRQISNISVVSDDGPTVRQHLQQQHRARLQQQLALQEKAKMDKDDLMTEYSGMVSPAVDKMLPVSTIMNLPATGSANMLVSTPMNMLATPSLPTSSMNIPVSPSMNIPASPSTNVPTSPSMNIPPSPSMNNSRISQMPRQQYLPRLAAQKPRIMTDPYQQPPPPSFCPQKQRAAEIHEEAIQRAAAVYNQIRGQKISPSGVNPLPQATRNTTFPPHSPITTTIAETSIETVPKKSPTRKRNHSMMSASQVRVTVLGTQSEPATQQIITESDHVLPIHGIAGLPKQPRIEMADTGPGKDIAPHSGDEKPPWQFVRAVNNAVPMGTSQTMEDCSKNDVGIDPSDAQKSFAIQINNNSFSLPAAEPLLNNPIGSSINGSGIGVISGASDLVTAQPVLSGNGSHLAESLREVMAQVDDDVINYSRETQYVRKLYFMKRLIESLVIKNGALCDEVSRLNQRIRTVMEERKVLAKRLQHHERNRIRRIQTKLKKQAAARAAKMNESQSVLASATSGTEGLPGGDIENYESDDSDKTLVSSGAASPNTSASMSRVETPEPASRSHEFISKMTPYNTNVQEGGKCKIKSGMRRHLSTKRSLIDRKEKKISLN